MTFWQRYAQSRLTRRRALAGMSLAAAGSALYLSGCGGGDGESGGAGSGLLSKPEDTTARAKAGGTLKTFSLNELPTMDALSSGAGSTFSDVVGYTYPRLLKFKPGISPASASGEVEGDLAETFELSPDKLQLTLKLRQGLKWEQKAPTSGREIDAQDVVFSWNKFTRLSSFASQVAYSQANPSAPVESLTAPDARTIVVKLRRPDPATLALFAWSRVNMMPRESDGGFDPKGEVRGYGPYLLDSASSTGYIWRKNPDYYVKNRPFVDRIEVPIIVEYASQLAQFRAGSIYTNVARTQDILQTKRDLPDTLLRPGDTFTTGVSNFLDWGWEGDSPVKDERVRLAIGYLIDRESYKDAITNRDIFVREGLEMPLKLASYVGPGWGDYYLDPLDEKAFGANAKYFKFDVAEAKRLLSAAGKATGLSLTLYWVVNRFGDTYNKLAEILPEMLKAGGIDARSEGVDYNNVYVPNILRGYSNGKTPSGAATNGVRMVSLPARATVDLSIESPFHPSGPSFVGMSPDGREASKGDPEITALIDKIRSEFDIRKQVDLVHQFQRAMAPKAYTIPLHWDTPGFTLTWPVVGNFGVHTVAPAGVPTVETQINYWIDASKKPLARG